MIDDATIKQLRDKYHLNPEDLSGASEYLDQLDKFARAIEQLARQEQREEDALVCETFGKDSEEVISRRMIAEAIRTSGKENKIDHI